jgi:hypothetical protein
MWIWMTVKVKVMARMKVIGWMSTATIHQISGPRAMLVVLLRSTVEHHGRTVNLLVCEMKEYVIELLVPGDL